MIIYQLQEGATTNLGQAVSLGEVSYFCDNCWKRKIQCTCADSKSIQVLSITVNSAHCDGCEYKPKRKVSGYGNVGSRLVIIGRDPGRHEEQVGIPFIGRSGALLTDTLSKVGLNRGMFYITNVVKCRPHRNKSPEKSIVEHCSKFLIEEMKIIKPRIILFLGQDAKKAEVVLQPHCPPNCIFVHAYHPAGVLRNLGLYEPFRQQLENLKVLIDQLGK